MEKSSQIQIGMLGVIILMLLYMMFSGGFSNSSSTATAKTDRDAARASLANNNVANKADATKPVTPPVPVGPLTKLEFSETEFDFGNITSGESVTHMFKFKNTGKEPLVISNAKGSCGCTVPKWPKEPILPGKSGEIEVKFDSKNKTGKQSKNVTITANTDPANTILKISADVAPDPNAPAKPAATTTGAPTIQPAITTGAK